MENNKTIPELNYEKGKNKKSLKSLKDKREQKLSKLYEIRSQKESTLEENPEEETENKTIEEIMADIEIEVIQNNQNRYSVYIY